MVPEGRCRSVRNMVGRWKDEDALSNHGQEMRSWAMLPHDPAHGRRGLHWFELSFICRDESIRVFKVGCRISRRKSGLHFLLAVVPKD